MQKSALAAFTAATLSALFCAATAAQEVRGISKDEILIGTLLDLSGPAAGPGTEVRNGMSMRIDEVNASGGIDGRKLRLLVEDHGYDPKKAVLAAEKLVGRDGIFMMVGQFGSATMLATLPILQRQGVINFFPLSSARGAFDPPSPLKYAFHASDFEQIKNVLPRLVKEKGLKKVCAIYQDDELGAEITRGAEAGLETAGLKLVDRMSFKRGSTDFSSQVAKAASLNCDTVVLATVVRETVGIMTEASKLNFRPVFVGSASAYSSAIPRLGGPLVEGLYATMVVQQPYIDAEPSPLQEWAVRYRTKYSADPTVFSAYGYFIVDSFVKAAQKASPKLSNDSFVQALDGMRLPATMFGTREMTFTPTRRLGNDVARLSQVQNGRWVVLKE